MEIAGLDLFSGTPGPRDVSRHGAPAQSLPYDGMPAYASETGALFVMECVAVFPGGPQHPPMLLPRSYMMAVARTQGDGLTALYDDPEAKWSWRPLLYSLGFTHTQQLGSQQELEYRKGLWDVQCYNADQRDALVALIVEEMAKLEALYGRTVPYEQLRKNARKRMERNYREGVERLRAAIGEATLPYVEANERAKRILREHLAPQQRIDLQKRGGFFVRGTINRLYFIEVGNGFSIVDPVTHRQTVSLCLHPEEWMPHDDVALATKLAIDSGEEGEAELLEAANPRLLAYDRHVTPHDRAAHRLEERFELYP